MRIGIRSGAARLRARAYPRWYGTAILALLSLAAWSLPNCHVKAATLEGERLAMIDSYALATPPTVETSAHVLAGYLVQPVHDDTEKARVIFRWVVDRIRYDVDAYFSNTLIALDAEQVMQQRRGICDGYAALFEKLAREAGLEVVTIKGYAKAYGHVPGTRFDRPNHAWNAVKIDGQWRFVDTTWGAGYVKGRQYVKELTETYFLAPPEQMMFTHFPVDPAWQLQSTRHLSKADFESMPDVEPAFFRLGILGEEAWNAMQSTNFPGRFVRTYDQPYHIAIVQHAPLVYQLPIGQAQSFSFQSERFEKMAVVLDQQWIPLAHNGRVFSGDVILPHQGDVLVVGKPVGSEEYTAILGYQAAP